MYIKTEQTYCKAVGDTGVGTQGALPPPQSCPGVKNRKELHVWCI